MANDKYEKLGTIVVQRTGPGAELDLCEVVGICDAPSYDLKKSNGEHFNWRQDLTRPATSEETVAYWKQRAIKAEELFNKAADVSTEATDKLLGVSAKYARLVAEKVVSDCEAEHRES